MSCSVRLMVVESSPFINRFLLTHHTFAQQLHVVGTVLNGQRALDKIRQLRPAVVTVDLDVANTAGLELLDRIMYECPTPVVLVSDGNPDAVQTTLEGLTLGAVDFIVKNDIRAVEEPAAFCHEMVGKIHAASRIRVIRSLQLRTLMPLASVQSVQRPPVSPLPPRRSFAEDGELSPSILVIGASTGGPTVLREILGVLPPDFPVPVIIVQHMPAAFTAVLAEQLDRYTPLRVREAHEGDELRSGSVLIAPGDQHLRLDANWTVRLSQEPPVSGHRPSIDVTMQSVARVYGAGAYGVVLTGMGNDGTKGLMAIHAEGGRTFTQESESCVVDGMPQRARETGIVDYVETPAQIARRLLTMAYPAHRSPPW